MVFRLATRLLVLAAPVLAAVPLAAQADVRRPVAAADPRFQPWVGCWRTTNMDPAAMTGGGPPAASPSAPPAAPAGRPTRACVLPAADPNGAVEVALYAADSLLSRTVIPIPGRPVARTIDECIGTESAALVAGDTRVVLRAELTCARGVRRVETGLMTITPAGEWMQIQHQEVAGTAATTVLRLRFDPEQTARLAAFATSAVSTPSLRLAVGGTVTSLHLLSVAQAVPVALAEAYVAELGLQFKLTGAALADLADAGMPPRVIDLLVAMAHPDRFQIGPAPVAGRAPAIDPTAAIAPVITAIGRDGAGRDETRRPSPCGGLDAFCYGPRGLGAWGLAWGYDPALTPWGYARFGMPLYGVPFSGYTPSLGYGYGVGYGAGWPYGYPVYYGNGPIVIVNRPPTGGSDGAGTGSARPSIRGRAVNGGGYTRWSDPSVGGATRPSTPSGGTSGGGSGGSSGGASTGGASSGEGASRTAKPRGGG